MAVLIEGLQGSGKSYYATYKMLHDADKYYKIHTNIDGIKTTDKIIPLEFKKFTEEILDECYRMQVVKDGSFEDSIEFLQKMYILPSNVSTENRILLVVDEAQNYFGKSVKLNPSLVWFITQHRHLYIELYLITQKYTLLRPDYHLFNLIYKAYPPVKQFSKKKIRYMEYAGLPQTADNLSRKFYLPKEKEVFDMYISGDKVDSPFILKKYLIHLAILLITLILAFKFFMGMFGGEQVEESRDEKIVNKAITNTNVSTSSNANLKEDISNIALYTIVTYNDGYFHIRGVADGKEFPIRLLPYIQEKFFFKVIEKEKKGFDVTFIYVLCKTSLNSFLDRSTNKREEQTNREGLEFPTLY